MGLEVIPGEALEAFMERAKGYYNDHIAEALEVIEAVEAIVTENRIEETVNQEQAPELPGERFEQFSLDKPRIDKDKGEMYGVRVMGIKSAHGYEYTLEAHRAASKHFEQMAVGIDHDYDGGPLTSEKAWGVFSNVRVDERGTLADLRYLKTHQRTEQILEDVERDLGIFSMSPVTQRCVERPKGSVISFVPVRCDLVVRGATTRKLFEQAPAPQQEEKKMELTPITKQQFEQMQAELDALKLQAAKFEQFSQARSDAAAAIEKTAAAVDLKKFWNE